MKKILYSIFTVLMFAVVNVHVNASSVYVCPNQVSILTLAFNDSCTRNSVSSTSFDLTSYYDSYMASHRGQQLASWGLTSNIGNFLNLVSVNGNTLSLSTSLLYNLLRSRLVDEHSHAHIRFLYHSAKK